MHQYEILPIVRLADVDTDNQSDVYAYQNSIGKLVPFKTLYFMKTMLSGSVKLIGQLIS